MKFDKRQIKKLVSEMKERVEEAILLNLKRVGEQFIVDARNNANFTDRTGNLRSSIGYVILKNGLQLVGSNWVQIKESGEGVIAGKKLIEELSRKYDTGLVLICVAGMDYAAAVESKGFDVITSSAMIAEQSLKKAIERLKGKIQKGKL